MARINSLACFLCRSLPALLLALLPVLAHSQPSSPSSAVAALDLAEKKFRAGKLEEAEHLYLQALQNSGRSQHGRCYDQLLTIYVRLGRFDRALQIVDRYQPMLEEGNDWTRVRELKLRRGELLLGLGHYRSAEPYLEEALHSTRGKPLAPGDTLNALMCLARSAEIRGDRPRARRYWDEVEDLARKRSSESRLFLTARQRIECVCMLADSYRFREQH